MEPTIIVKLVNGRLHVEGNVPDKLVQVGMLEAAKAALLNAPPAQERPAGVAVPNGALTRRLLEGRG